MASMRERLPHALLLQGRKGMGKFDFARLLSQSLLCETPLEHAVACGVCSSCNWFMQDNHPDFRLMEPAVAPESGEESAEVNAPKTGRKTQITVDQVRDLMTFTGLSSHRAGLRIVLIHPAEALNAPASNALLKILEEPPPSVLFLMVSHQPQQLLPTVRSRCIKVDMPLPASQQAADWLDAQKIPDAAERLAYSGGAPLQALQLEEADMVRDKQILALLALGHRMDPFAVTELCVKSGLAETLQLMQKWLLDLFLLRITGSARYQPRPSSALQELANRVDLSKLLGFQRYLGEAVRYAQHPLKAELQIDGLMVQYMQLVTTSVKS